MIPDELVAVMGHWGSKDPMPGVYDSSNINTELVYKSYVCKCYIAGWRLQPYGAIPMPAPLPLNAVVATGASDASGGAAEHTPAPSLSPTVDAFNPNYLRKGTLAQIELNSKYKLPDSVDHVVNLKTEVVHLFHSGTKTVCGAFKCGRPSSYHSDAHFASTGHAWSGESAPYDFCASCFSEPSFLRLGASRISNLPDSSDSDVSSSSSSSSDRP